MTLGGASIVPYHTQVVGVDHWRANQPAVLVLLDWKLDAVVTHGAQALVNIRGKRYYLWRAVDQDGDVIDILIQKRKNKKAALRFFRKLLKGQGSSPNRLVKLACLPRYAVAFLVLGPRGARTDR